jgi:hypothetical protein
VRAARCMRIAGEAEKLETDLMTITMPAPRT